MTPKFPAANKLAVLFAATAVVAVGLGTRHRRSAKPRRSRRNMTTTAAPITGRAAQLVLSAGSAHAHLRHQALLARCRRRGAARRRKFTDYAFPPASGIPTFARENNNRPIDRQPLNPPRTWAAIRGVSRCTDRRQASIQQMSSRRTPGLYHRRDDRSVLASVSKRQSQPWIPAQGRDDDRKIAPTVQRLQFLQDRFAHLRGRTAVVPSDLISAVRRPLASTAAIAASSLSASAPMSNE